MVHGGSSTKDRIRKDQRPQTKDHIPKTKSQRPAFVNLQSIAFACCCLFVAGFPRGSPPSVSNHGEGKPSVPKITNLHTSTIPMYFVFKENRMFNIEFLSYGGGFHFWWLPSMVALLVCAKNEGARRHFYPPTPQAKTQRNFQNSYSNPSTPPGRI